MPTRKRSIAPLIAAASAASLAACAADSERAPESPYAPIVIDSYHTPTPADLYAQQFRTSAAQVRVGGAVRFVRCGDECLGPTPKTPVARIQTVVARAVKQQQGTAETIEDSPKAEASEARPHAAIAPGRALAEPQKPTASGSLK